MFDFLNKYTIFHYNKLKNKHNKVTRDWNLSKGYKVWKLKKRTNKNKTKQKNPKRNTRKTNKTKDKREKEWEKKNHPIFPNDFPHVVYQFLH